MQKFIKSLEFNSSFMVWQNAVGLYIFYNFPESRVEGVGISDTWWNKPVVSTKDVTKESSFHNLCFFLVNDWIIVPHSAFKMYSNKTKTQFILELVQQICTLICLYMWPVQPQTNKYYSPELWMDPDSRTSLEINTFILSFWETNWNILSKHKKLIKSGHVWEIKDEEAEGALNLSIFFTSFPVPPGLL